MFRHTYIYYRPFVSCILGVVTFVHSGYHHKNCRTSHYLHRSTAATRLRLPIERALKTDIMTIYFQNFRIICHCFSPASLRLSYRYASPPYPSQTIVPNRCAPFLRWYMHQPTIPSSLSYCNKLIQCKWKLLYQLLSP